MNKQNITGEYSDTWTAYGYVQGNLWGGGLGWYESTRLEAPTEKELECLVEKGIKDGSFDSGMGFDGINGAMLDIVHCETVMDKTGRRWVSRSHDPMGYKAFGFDVTPDGDYGKETREAIAYFLGAIYEPMLDDLGLL